MEQVNWFKNVDPAMQRPNDEARSNFRYFWRERTGLRSLDSKLAAVQSGSKGAGSA